MRRKIRRIPEGQERLPFRNNRGGMWAYAAPSERRAVFVLGFLLVAISVFYMYSVLSSVMHVAKRQELSLAGSTLSAKVAHQEAEYLTRTENITESYARSRGFVSIGSRSFVEQSNSVSLNN